MRLTDGQVAPDFTIADVTGKQISLESFKGQYVLLSFFRYAGCPFCDLTLIKLIERYDNFANRGLKTVAFFQSSDESIDKYVSDKHPPFPVIADPDKLVYDKYAIESSRMGGLKSVKRIPITVSAILKGEVVQGKIGGDAFLMPAQFIVGPDSKIVKAHYGSDFADKIPLFEIEELILTKISQQ
jgi:peroxiredoxin Q/BCP